MSAQAAIDVLGTEPSHALMATELVARLVEHLLTAVLRVPAGAEPAPSRGHGAVMTAVHGTCAGLRPGEREEAIGRAALRVHQDGAEGIAGAVSEAEVGRADVIPQQGMAELVKDDTDVIRDADVLAGLRSGEAEVSDAVAGGVAGAVGVHGGCAAKAPVVHEHGEGGAIEVAVEVEPW